MEEHPRFEMPTVEQAETFTVSDPVRPYRDLGKTIRDHDELIAELLYELSLLEIMKEA